MEPFFCEKDHRLARVEVNLNEATGAVTCGAQEILINDWCTGSNHHGGGGMAFLANGDMALTVGDMSKVSRYHIPGTEYLMHGMHYVYGLIIYNSLPGSLQANRAMSTLAPGV